MLQMKLRISVCVVWIYAVLSASAQQAAPGAANAVVPPVIRFGGVLTDVNNKPLTGPVGVTFALYKDAEGGAPLWVETQTVTPDKTGHYTVMLGSTTSQGVPPSVFAAGEARWLGVQVHDQAEQPRTLLMSVPYALKALDAETIGGKPLSALQLASPNGGSGSSGSNQSAQANTITCSSGSACKKNFVPVFASNGGAATVTDSIIQESGSTISVAGSQTLEGSITAASTSTDAAAVRGTDNSSSNNGAGVVGVSTNGLGIEGESTNGTGVYGSGITGVYATGAEVDGYGVYASGDTAVYGSGYAVGVFGTSGPSTGVLGTSSSYIGVYGSGPTGVAGVSSSGSTPTGVYAQASAGGWAVDAIGTGGATGVLAGSDYGYAAWFNGDVQVDGTLSAWSKDFKIDHPLDPANKYLVHASVESSEMMNIYTGNVTTNAQGEATVQLPNWFEALNRDFRYQLTVIGQFAQAIVARKIANHQFQIRTNAPTVEVSWQVTGVRQDVYAKAYPLQIEEDKPAQERGLYLRPELYGQPEEKGVLWGRAPSTMKQWKAARMGLVSSEQPAPAKQ